MKKILAIFLALVMLLGAMSVLPFTASATGWDGTASTSLKGSGTEEDPYLISSPGDFKYFVEKVDYGIGALEADDGKVTQFEDVYFEQTCDLDFNGKAIYPVGYYFNGSTRFRSFNGTYDGKGFSIKNLTVNGVHGASNWYTGLFGLIYGATLKNIVVEDMTHSSAAWVVGGLVGYAMGDATHQNVIENCVVRSSCKISSTQTTLSGVNNDATNIGQVRMGGIVATGAYTTIRSCINEADLVSNENQAYIGGIIGTGSLNVTVENCVNKGDMTVKVKSGSFSRSEIAAGGIIAAAVSRIGNEKTSKNGPLSVTNCYNTGKFILSGAANPNMAISYGGILGQTNSLTANNTYLIQNCYNLNADNDCSGDAYTNGGEVRIGGLVGSSWHAGGGACATLQVKDSFSVAVSTLSNSKVNRVETNEYVYTGNQSSAGEMPLTPTNVGTKTEAEILVYTKAIDKAMNKAQIFGRDSIVAVGVQESSATDDYKVRVVGVINTLDVQKVGCEVTLGTQTLPLEGTTVYSSIKGGANEYTPDKYDGSYFVPLVFNAVDGENQPASGTVSVRFYVITKAGQKVYGSDAVELTFENGELTNPAADIE